MLSVSDDDIADALWDTDGGPGIVSRVAADIGLGATQPPDVPAQWGETLTNAADAVRIYHYIGAEIPQPARDLILTALHQASATPADGTDQYFGIPDALTGTDWAIKQGWMTRDDSTTLNTTGLVSTDPARPLRGPRPHHPARRNRVDHRRRGRHRRGHRPAADPRADLGGCRRFHRNCNMF